MADAGMGRRSAAGMATMAMAKVLLGVLWQLTVLAKALFSLQTFYTNLYNCSNCVNMKTSDKRGSRLSYTDRLAPHYHQSQQTILGLFSVVGDLFAHVAVNHLQGTLCSFSHRPKTCHLSLASDHSCAVKGRNFPMASTRHGKL